MRLSILLSSLTLAGTLASSAIPPSDSTALDLEKREPAPAAFPEPVNVESGDGEALEERQGQGEVSSPRSGTPSRGFSPDSSGQGYGVDYRGQGRPSWCPRDWQYYGRDIGWAPYRGWQPPRGWKPPVIFIRIWIKVTWWSPPGYWRNYWFNRWDRSWYRYGIPVHWGWRPRPSHGPGSWHKRGNGWYSRSRRGGD
ncbi:hypothetical protein JCM11641_003074 [Rhodosporidiobolus odoratus]